jgi:hypothetical protein
MTPEQQTELTRYRSTITDGRGLTAGEWRRFDWLEKSFDPDAYKQREAAGRRRYLMDLARQLSAEDLRALLVEKEAEQSTPAKASA